MEIRLFQLERRAHTGSYKSAVVLQESIKVEMKNDSSSGAIVESIGDANLSVQSEREVMPSYVDVHDLNCPKGFASNFTPWNITLFKWWLGTLGPCYPEQCSKVVLVNTPWAFYTGWSVAKSWLPARTVVSLNL
jgi:hypothetical protein